MAAIPPLLNKELAVIKSETAPTIAMANSLQVVDAASYVRADVFLGKLVDARKQVKARLSRFLDPLKSALDSAKEAYKQAQAFHEEVDAPLAGAEGIVRQSMKAYKLEEARQARLAEEKAEAEAAELRRQASAKLIAEQKAKTEQMRQKLAAQRAELETKADLAEAAPAPVALKVEGSTTRTTYTPEVVNMHAFLEAMLAGKIKHQGIELLETLLMVNTANLKGIYRVIPDQVAKWPGVQIIEDVQIVKKGR